MKLKVRVEFPSEQADTVRHFCKEVGMTAEEFCRRAVLYAMNDSYRRAQEEQEKLNALHNAESGVPQSDPAAGLQPSEHAGSDPLPDKEVIPFDVT